MPLDIQPRLQPAERPADREPVFERIARPRRRAEVIGEDTPFAGRPAPEIERDEMEVPAPGRIEPDHRAQEIGAAGDERGGDQAAFDQSTLAVKIGDHRFHQFGALDHTAGDRIPFRRFDEQRNGGDGPGPFVCLADDPKARADIGGVALDAFARMSEVVARDAGQFLEHRAPGGIVVEDIAADRLINRAARAILGYPAPGMGRGIEQRGGSTGHVRGLPPVGRAQVLFTLRRGGATLILPCRGMSGHRSGST